MKTAGKAEIAQKQERSTVIQIPVNRQHPYDRSDNMEYKDFSDFLYDRNYMTW